MIRKGIVVFHRDGSVGLCAKSPMKNRGIPLPSRLGTKAGAGEPGFSPTGIKTRIVAILWPPKPD
jgi:hypothetical protein